MPKELEDKWKLSPNYIREMENLPEGTRIAFESLVGQYRFLALRHHRQAFVSYKVLADLIREGWRQSE